MNMDKVDENVRSVDRNDHMEGVTHSHPCFGMIGVYRTCGGDGSELFGSEIKTNNTMRIEISEAEVTQSLGRNWYHARRGFTEIEMSPVQYAELISNPNTEGVPCTIRYRSDKGRIIPRSIDTVTEYVEKKVDSHLKSVGDRASSLVSDITMILTQKGTVKKADKEEVIRIVNRLASDINSNLQFYTDSAVESIDKAKLEAKVEIDSYVTHAIASAGIKAINNPETLKLLIGHEDSKGGDVS